MIFFTSICANYAHKARTLAESVKKHIPDAKFLVCLTEQTINKNIFNPNFDDIILAKDAWEGDFDQFIFKHSIVEASTSVKGQFFRYLYKTYPEDQKFIYLDPDTYVYSDFIELRRLMDEHPIILSPHLLYPGNIEMELSSTAHGVYNLGFLAVNRSEEAIRFIDWWASRLFLYCYDDIERGIFTDQKWIDLAPCFFDTYILKHNGYNYAIWSLLNSEVSFHDDQYFVFSDPLRFIHFSGYGETAETCIRNWLPEGDHLFKNLYREYSVIHDANDHDNVSKTPWSYGFYSSGEKISNSVRIKYRSNQDIMLSTENPFEESNSYFNSVFSNTKNKPYQYYQKAVSIYQKEGFSALMAKVIKKLVRS